MYKIIVFNSQYEPIETISEVTNPNVTTDNVFWDNGKMEGIKLPFVVIDEGEDISQINKQFVLDYLKKLYTNKMSQECKDFILQGFYSAVTQSYYGFSEKDQINFNQQLTLMLLDPTVNEVYWKTEDKGVIPHTRDEFIAVCKEGEKHKRHAMRNYYIITDNIREMRNFEELKGLVSFNHEVEKLNDNIERE